MAARLDSVCKFICAKGGWRVSNLQLQKVLYLAQMVHLGRTGQRLADARFEAWDYGPVEPSVYRKVRMFGAAPVQDVFYDALPFKDDDDRKILLDEVCASFLNLRPGSLVDLTHWPKGAWAAHYVPGARGITIPDDAIVREYHDRLASSRAAA